MPATGSGKASAVFLVAAWGFLLSMFYRVSATVISPLLTSELDLTSMQLSTLSSTFFYAFAVFQIPAGPALDRIGPRRTMSFLGLVAVCGAMLFAASQGYAHALLGRMLLGIGMACNLMGAFALVAAWFPAERFATLAGVLTAAGTAGMIFAATPLAWLAETVGWRETFTLVAVLNLAQVAMLFVFVRDAPDKKVRASEGGREEMMKRIVYLWTRPWFWVVNLATFFRFGAFMALQGLLAGPYLIYGHDLSPVQTGNVLLACSLGYVAGLPLAGRLSDKTLNTRKYVVAPALLLSAALFSGLTLLSGGAPMAVYAGLFLVIGFFSAPGNIVYAHIKELCPLEMSGTAMSGVNLFNMLGPAVLIQVGGAFMPENPAGVSGPEAFRPVWLIFAAGLAVSGLFYFAVPDTRRNASRT